jgi:hypothetical protein
MGAAESDEVSPASSVKSFQTPRHALNLRAHLPHTSPAWEYRSRRCPHRARFGATNTMHISFATL